MDVLSDRLRNWGDVPSLTALRVHYLLWDWLSPFKEADLEDHRATSEIFARLEGGPRNIMAIVLSRLEAAIQKAMQEKDGISSNENLDLSRERCAWTAKQIDNLTKFRMCGPDLCTFLDLVNSCSISRRSKAIVVEAIGGEESLRVLQQLRGKNGLLFLKNRLKSYREEEATTSDLREQLSQQSIP